MEPFQLENLKVENALWSEFVKKKVNPGENLNSPRMGKPKRC